MLAQFITTKDWIQLILLPPEHHIGRTIWQNPLAIALF
jgi:hypothetical protein